MTLRIPKRVRGEAQPKAWKRAPQQEREVAERTGGKQTPGSGNQSVKGDVRVTDIARIECKATERKSFSVTRDMLDKLAEHGESAGEVPVFHIEFLATADHPGGSLVVCPDYVLEMLKGN